MNDAVAVVVPAHNAASYLATALRSVLEQTMAPAEIVVVDDGSTDDTHAVAEGLGVRCVRQRQGGPAAARNRGIAETRSPLLAFLDADDWFAPGKLERQVERLQELGAQVVCSDAWLVVQDRVVRTKNEDRGVPTALTLERLLAGNPIICSTVLARRDAVRAAGGFDEDPVLVATEDYDLWLRMARVEPIAYSPEPLAFYRAHAGSLSANARFVAGVDRAMAKIADVYGDEPHYRRLVRRRRAMVRHDLAWDLLKQGRLDECRAVLRDARALAGTSWRSLRLWLRTWLPVGR